MDIIIHGKPLDASERYSSGIDKDLARKIIDDFFSIGSIKEPEVLVVDARYWNGKWYSVYTLFLSGSIKDTAGRGSYFAISLIIPNRYCCLISEVYYLLEEVVRENVLGVYLNSNFQYIVSNFENHSAFDRLYAKLESEYSNIEKSYDNSFRPQANLNNDNYCSLFDCDSLSLLNVLKSKGRVIIGENAETKDTLASKSMEYFQSLQQAKVELQTKSTKISDLEKQISQLEKTISSATSSASGKLKKLKEEIASLKADKERLESEKEKVEKEYANLNDKILQACSLLEPVKNLSVHKKKDLTSKNKTISKNGKIDVSYYIPLFNTLLLIFLIILGIFLTFKGCTSITQNNQVNVDSLNMVITEKNSEIDNLNREKEKLINELEECQEKLKDLSHEINFARQQRPIIPSQKTPVNNGATKKDIKVKTKKESESTQQTELNDKK